jgi:hypothetical protein
LPASTTALTGISAWRSTRVMILRMVAESSTIKTLFIAGMP